MGFNWEADTEPLEDRYCECGQHYKIDLYPGAKEGHYAVTARPVIKPGSSVEYQTLDADETICVLCGEEVPFDDILIEGPVSSAQYRELSQLEGVEVEG